MLDPIGIEVLQLDLVVVQQSLEEWMRGIMSPRSWKGAKETMLPSGGIDTSSWPGTNHSIASVLLRRRSRLTRPSMRAWVTSEWYHDSMESEDGGARTFWRWQRSESYGSGVLAID